MTPRVVPFRKIRQHWTIYFFVLPALFMLALFQYYPAASGVFHSFFRWNGADISEYVGLENYLTLLNTPAFWDSFRVVLILGLANVLKMIPAIAVAVCIHRCSSQRVQFFYRLLFVIPMVIPALVIALIWRSFFFESNSGLLNTLLETTGLLPLLTSLDSVLHLGGIFSQGTNPSWLGDPTLMLVSCIIWGFPWVGSFAVLTHLAKLQNISRDIYEAATIDGINWFSKFTRIELPLIMGSIYLMLVFVIIETIKDAGMVLALAGIHGGPGGQVTVPALFMIQKAFLNQEMGAACAVGIVLMFIVMGLQKMSSVVLAWDEAPPSHRFFTRLAFIAIGLLLMWQFSWWLLGSALITLALPWPTVVRGLRFAMSSSQQSALHPRSVSTPAPRKRPTPSALTHFLQPITSLFLRVAKHAFILGVLALALLPLYLMIVVSLKTNVQFYDNPTALTPPYHFENWSHAFRILTPTIFNSLFIAISSTALTLAIALAAAYFFARLRMPFSSILWNAFLILMAIPTIANLVPLFRLLADLNLLNTLWALILVGTSGGIVFGVFVIRSFIEDIPQELFEAAEIDGCSHFRQVINVVLPLAAPVLGTVGVMHFIAQWNEFVLPLIIIRDKANLPAIVELLRMSGEYVKQWGPLMAGYTLVSVPVIILFIMTMRLFNANATEGAVKG